MFSCLSLWDDYATRHEWPLTMSARFGKRLMATRLFKIMTMLVLARSGEATQAEGSRVEFVIVDTGTGRPIPCRVHLKDSRGKPVRAEPLPFWHDHFVCPG